CQCHPGWTHDVTLILVENCGVPAVFFTMIVALSGWLWLMELFYNISKLIKKVDNRRGRCETYARVQLFFLIKVLSLMSSFMIQLYPSDSLSWIIVANIFYITAFLTTFFTA